MTTRRLDGRIKVFVPGVYSDKYQTQPANLPWARPLSPSFGGGAPNPNNNDKHCLNDEVGWCSVPHYGNIETGSQVFVFFENCDINFPVYFGVAQSGEGWFSEHPNQHCFRSDNIRVRIDENVKDPRSTCKFNSYNTYNSKVAKRNLERDCAKFEWKYNEDEGNIEQLETRLDIEIEATKINAVNLNIHGNVNMHIDGDWFVEHFGNKYEYQKGDLYVKHDGQTYIEEDGHYRKVHNGNYSLEHNGNTVENQEGDTLITRTGTYWSQIDNDVTHIYNGNYKIKINGNSDELIRNDKIVDVGNGLHMNVIENVNTIIGGHLSVSVDTHIDLDIKDNFEIHSRIGNIILKTDGDFELMKGQQITGEGFKNLGSRGNIQLISTFGNINVQCVKNESIANFGAKSTVIPWNPDFVREIKENASMFPTFSCANAALKGMEFTTNVNGLGDFIKLMKDAQELLIYDGLPVFLPTKMIVQNPNITMPRNAEDLSWIPTFRDEATDWRSMKDDVMWKLPGRVMGNINIETWSGDITIKTESELGCAGNINLTAIDKVGTMPGYKIGTINFLSKGEERIYPDPRDLFLDSDFFQKLGGQLSLFKHGTNGVAGSVLPAACDGIVKQTGYSFNWKNTNYEKFYLTYGMNVATQGFTQPVTKIISEKYNAIIDQDPPIMGCSKCIGDYLLGLPGIQEIYYLNENLVEIKGGFHQYGFNRLNPKDISNPRGTFNITAGSFGKISMGDGHAIGHEFMKRDFGTTNIGGMTFNLSGDMSVDIGKNYYRTINNLEGREDGKVTEHYELIQSPYDFNVPQIMKTFFKIMKMRYENNPDKWVKAGSTLVLRPEDAPKPYEAAGGYNLINDMYNGEYMDGGYVNEYIRNVGKREKLELDDHRRFVDFGFDLERCKDLMQSMDPTLLELNLMEQERYRITANDVIETDFRDGGDSRWFQVRCYDLPDCMTHVEASGSFNEHTYKFNDMAKQWVKSHHYHDQGFVWWDDNKFDSDLVPWFPDSQFDIQALEVRKLWNEITVEREHHSWSKYGNHRDFKAKKHPEYNMQTDKCGSTHMVVKGGEKLVNTAPKLWKKKKGAGIRVTKNTLVTSNQIEPHDFSLNMANCHKNETIETSTVWNSAVNIKNVETIIAGKNLFDEHYFKSDVNKHVVEYTAAVNSDILTLNSDHIIEIPDKEPDGCGVMATGPRTIKAGNLCKRSLVGNHQDYFAYNSEETELGKMPEWKHSVYSNNFEFAQNGFPINSYKILNGTNTMWPGVDAGPELDWAKCVKNEMIISNGGNGDPEASHGVSYFDPINRVSIPAAGSLPLTSNNTFYLTNGINNGTSHSLNSVNVENGTGTIDAANITTVTNGDSNISGYNMVRIDNQGSGGAEKLVNSITLNNDNQNTNIILSDEYDVELSSFPIVNAAISEYALWQLNKHSDGEVNIEAPTAVIAHDDIYVDSTSKYIFRGNEVKADANEAAFVFNTTDFDTSKLSIRTDSTSVHATNYKVIASYLNQVGTNTSIEGDAMEILASNISMNRVTAVGNFVGHLDGTMDGLPLVFGLVPMPLPIDGSHVNMPSGPSTTASPTAPASPATAAPPIPLPNDSNGETYESESKSVVSFAKSIINKFIEIELSLLDTMNGRF